MQSELINSIINIILITGVVYGLIFNAIVFFSKKRKGKPLLYLNLLVLAITLNNLQAWLITEGHVSTNIYIKFLRIPWYFLCMPMFYVFMVYYLKIQKELNTFLWTTVILFLQYNCNSPGTHPFHQDQWIWWGGHKITDFIL